ncbi:MAG TPA: tetratricopeptide repeat protein [Phycisphaerae bacterium]|nr:tetratricopeptide repeat protein [Phycisphaerae bacterium]HRY69299.1 tetratricopeptide repeat protein [Phycisphaerae bacterium]HSA26617.1 tetratricopeptide repeat protein [Phycisphaerae bacterium]
MSKAENPSSSGDDARPAFTDGDIARARQWFRHGQQLVEKKNYDYAIESYITGLEFWPEAVEEGHKPCRAAALFRGPRKVSFTDGIKYKTNAKDTKRSMLNAEVLLSKDPGNIDYMEAMFKNAAKSRFDQTTLWIGELLADAAVKEPKPRLARFVLMRTIYEELGDRNANTDPPMAIAGLERAVQALSRLQALKPQDLEISTDLRDVAGKLTILRGKYGSADSFKDSIRDSDAQAEIRDQERIVQSDERLDQLIAAAERRYSVKPSDKGLINELVDLLCRRDDENLENKAIQVLEKAFTELREYRFKLKADDIRMRQLKRRSREVLASGSAEEAKRMVGAMLKLELSVFKERCEQYPTDLRLRYQYGQRLFQAKRYDEAIPVLQEARADPKTRGQCSLLIGQCFFKKGYYSAAIDTLREAIKLHEVQDNELGKDLHYRLARALEEDGRIEETLKIYGQIIQWDYNYRNGEVRKRIDDLRKRQEDEKAAKGEHPKD